MDRRSWNGRFSLAVRGRDMLELREEQGGVQLLLLGAREVGAAERADQYAGRPIARVEVCWRDGGATVHLDGDGGARALSAAQVIVHEPLARLYDDLHLPELSVRTRRFWRRLFLLARLPGGAALIRFIARRTRAKA